MIDRPNKVDLNYHHVEIDEIISKVPTWLTKSGTLLVSSFIFLFLILSLVVSYPEVIIVPMILKSANSPVQMYAHQSGIIDSIYVQDNDTVTTDQVIIYIQNSASLADVNNWKLWLKTLIISSKKDSLIKLPSKSLQLGDLSNSYSNILQHLYEWNHLKEGEDLENQLSALGSEKNTLSMVIESLEEQSKVYEDQYALLQKDMARQNELFTGGVISEYDYERSENQFLAYKRQQIAFNMEIASNKLQLNQIDREKIKTIHSYNDKLNLLYLSIIEMSKNAFNEANEWETDYVVKAGTNGVVSIPSSTKINSLVTEGTVLLSVIPIGVEGSTYATIKVNSQDLSHIQVGNKVVVKLDSWPSSEYGSFYTTVDKIGVLPIPGNSHSLFEVNITLKDKAKTSTGKVLNLKPEEPGVARIITKDEKLLYRIFHKHSAEHKH